MPPYIPDGYVCGWIATVLPGLRSVGLALARLWRPGRQYALIDWEVPRMIVKISWNYALPRFGRIGSGQIRREGHGQRRLHRAETRRGVSALGGAVPENARHCDLRSRQSNANGHKSGGVLGSPSASYVSRRLGTRSGAEPPCRGPRRITNLASKALDRPLRRKFLGTESARTVSRHSADDRTATGTTR